MTNNCTVTFSIIIATFNAGHRLQKCIDSISSQTCKNYELIIIDGGSTDNTLEIIRHNQSLISHWISEKDHGIYDAWNKGLDIANGEWVLFIGADDFLWSSDSLEKIASTLINMPDLNEERVIYAQVMLVNQNNENILLAGKPWEQSKAKLQHGMPIPHQGTLHHKKLFIEYGKFDYSYRIAGDYELLLRHLKSNKATFIPNIILCGMEQGGISSDPRNSLLLLKELRKAQVKHQQKLSLYWILALMRVYIRVSLWKILGEKRAKSLLDMGRIIMGESPYWTKLK